MMNAEVTKAIKKSNRKSAFKSFKKWLGMNAHKVFRVVFFPVWVFVWSKDKIDAHLDSKTVWDEKRASDILSYYVPRVAEWNNEKKYFYFFDNGCGWRMHIKHIKLKDRRFWKKFVGWSGMDMRRFLNDKFELEGFTKEVEEVGAPWIEITFYLKES